MITWTRMQNVLLAIAAFLLVSLFWSQMCYTVGSDGVRYAIKYTEHLQFLLLTFISLSLTIAAICYRKQYILQMRVCIIDMFVLLGFQIWLLVAFFQLKQAYTFTISTLFPLVCIVLIVLAIRYSWRDASEVIARDFHRKVSKKLKK